MHLLVDSTGLKLCGPGEWLVEKHGTKMRRAWKKLHIGVDADTGQILASTLTGNEVDDGSQADLLIGQVTGPLASFAHSHGRPSRASGAGLQVWQPQPPSPASDEQPP